MENYMSKYPCFPITVTRKTYGYLVVNETKYKANEYDLIAIEHASTIIKLEIQREISNDEIERKYRDNLVLDIIYNNINNPFQEEPREKCRQSIMEKMQVSEKEADRLITKTDKYRAEYYKYYTGGDYWTNPTSYDLTINTGRVGRERAVDLIIDYLKMRFGDKLI